MDIGVLQTGAQTVPIYPTISEDDYEYILNHSGNLLFCIGCRNFKEDKFNS
jgi:long-chain acyl-CoA synthetase